MNDLATITPKVRITPLGLDITEELSFEEWSSLAPAIGGIARSLSFVVGDWLAYGERFAAQRPLPGFEDMPTKVDPKRYDKALLKTGLDRGTLCNYASVSRSVPRSLRNEHLSWEHHRAVARLDPDAQRHWIDVTIAENDAGRRMSSRRLRRSIEAGRIVTVAELRPVAADTGILNHIPFVNRLVGWWARMRDSNWLKTASADKRAALKRDLQPIIEIYEQL
jgi:hypothetical protein